MLKNYIKIAYRNLVKHPGFSLINLFGLSVGMTCCVLIFLYINHELNYDKFHAKAPQIYRLVTDVKTPTEVIKADITSAPMAPNLKATFPEVLEAVRFNYFSFLVQRGDNKWQEKNALLADAAVFKVFDFPLIKGNPETALKAPFSLVLTETVALKIGVVDNYRQQGANSPVNPTVLNYSANDLNYYVVDIGERRADQVLPQIKATYKKLFPASPFEYYFLDEHYDKQYRSEKQFAKLFSLAAFVTIFIAIMGILGVTTQLIIQRNKEVSIRKILGASVTNIFRLIFKEYVVWLLVCYVRAIPTSYYLFSAWLENFLIRISLEWWFFIIPAFLVAFIFVMSTLYQTIKIALVNPAETLKAE